MKDNEEIACNALRSVLLVRGGTFYTIERRPDKENSNSKDIDFVMGCPGQPRIAVEHTSIESFEGQLSIGFMHADFVNEIARQINIPSSTYYKLNIPVEMYIEAARKDRDSLITTIANWINFSMPNLKPHGRQTKIDVLGGKYAIWLGQGGSHPNLDGKLIPSLIAPKELESARKERIARALSSKLPKLIPYGTNGMLTFLLLEDWDISLSNSQIIKDVVLKVRREYREAMPYAMVQVTSVSGENRRSLDPQGRGKVELENQE